MIEKRNDKLSAGDLAYSHPSTNQSEGTAGVVLEVASGLAGDEPHIKFQPTNGANPVIMDYKKVDFGGGPPRKVQGKAIVKWLTDRVPSAEAHVEWPVEQITDDALDYYWVLARDPWEGRLHWLRSRSESGDNDSVYTLDVRDADGRSRKVTMQEFPH